MTARESAEQKVAEVGAEISKVDQKFRKQAEQLLYDANLNVCFQCGVCTGTCPTGHLMQYGPRKIVQMIRLGLVDRALRSPDIWSCVSCYSCSASCPQGVPISDVMSVLRNLAISEGLAKDEEATFSKLFLRVVEEHGRMYEPEVMLRYFASVRDIGAIVQIMPLGLSMVLKGKLGLLPERIKRPKDLSEMHDRVSGGEVS